MSTLGQRIASHAGTWYIDNPLVLRAIIDACLKSAPKEDQGKAKIIVSPHAGYNFCGVTQGHAYSALKVTDGETPVTTVFVLGPSHFLDIPDCAISPFKSFETPFGDVPVNEDIVNELLATEKFSLYDPDADIGEHSVEMQIPFLHRRFDGKLFTIVPIYVGELDLPKMREYGKIFAKYLNDPSCVFAISSDFCHWGDRYDYKYLNKEWMNKEGDTISDSITMLDLLAAEKITDLDIQGYVEYSDEYKSPICGKNAIIIAMSAMEEVGFKGTGELAHYSQSDKVTSEDMFSVSYCAITFSF